MVGYLWKRRPQSATDEDTAHQVETATLEGRRFTVRQLAQDVKISIGSVDRIIHDHLHIQKLSSRRVPRLITFFQKQERFHSLFPDSSPKKNNK